MYVYTHENFTDNKVRAKIIQDLGDDVFVIEFDDGTTRSVSVTEFGPYYPCKCDEITYQSSLDVLANALDSVCFLPNYTVIKNAPFN
jgi:hypothetical protein